MDIDEQSDAKPERKASQLTLNGFAKLANVHL